PENTQESPSRFDPQCSDDLEATSIRSATLLRTDYLILYPEKRTQRGCAPCRGNGVAPCCFRPLRECSRQWVVSLSGSAVWIYFVGRSARVHFYGNDVVGRGLVCSGHRVLLCGADI